MAKRTIIPFGPQHPVLPEPIHLDLVLEDETEDHRQDRRTQSQHDQAPPIVNQTPGVEPEAFPAPRRGPGSAPSGLR